MFLRRPTERPHRRGQALVEFAMVLPLLVLLLVMAIDFGRVFFGWVALQNTARIGADFAAQNWEAWPSDTAPPSVQARADYQVVMTNDLQAANCTYATPLPGPAFADVDSPANGMDWGDLVTVTLTCEFDLITPLAENILGGPITLSAESTFALHGTASGGVPSAPPAPCDDPEAVITSSPAPGPSGRIEIRNSNRTVQFTDSTAETASCQVESRTWTITPPGGIASTAETFSHTFPPHSGSGFTSYTVTLNVTTDEGTDSTTVTVRVRA